MAKRREAHHAGTKSRETDGRKISKDAGPLRQYGGGVCRRSGAAAARDATGALLMAAVVSQSPDDRNLADSAVRDGIWMEIGLELDRKGDVNMDVITRHSIIPRKTWESAKKSGADVLSPVNSERVLRVALVTAKARDTFGRKGRKSGSSAQHLRWATSHRWRACHRFCRGRWNSCSAASITVSPLDPVARRTPRFCRPFREKWSFPFRPLAFRGQVVWTAIPCWR